MRILHDAALHRIPMAWVVLALIIAQLFLVWIFGHTINWQLDILWIMTCTMFMLLLPAILGVDKADDALIHCILAARCVSFVYLLNWQAPWQAWPIPTVSAIAVTYTAHLLVHFVGYLMHREKRSVHK